MTGIKLCNESVGIFLGLAVKVIVLNYNGKLLLNETHVYYYLN